MLEHEAGADIRLVRQISAGMKIQAGGEHTGCSKVADNPENQVICLQCQEELVRVCPGSPRSPRRAIAPRFSSGSAGNGGPICSVQLHYFSYYLHIYTCVVDIASSVFSNFAVECGLT